MQYPDIFRGFIPLGTGKRPVAQYTTKEAKIYPYDEVCRGNFAGLLKEGWCFIDVDDEDISELLYKIINEYGYGCHIQKTTRGHHFYYKNPGVRRNRLECKTAIGLVVELHVNTNQPVPMKVDNEDREWLRILDETEEEELPMWLHHCPAIEDYDFKNLQSGSRNDTYFRYKGALLRCGFDGKSINDTIEIINKYIALSPLPAKELSTILRDTEEVKKKTFYMDGRFQHSIFGDFLINNNKFALIDNRFHIQNKEYLYTPDEDEIERVMIESLSIITAAQRQETLKYIRLMCHRKLQLSDETLIPLKDKIYDLKTDTLLDYNSQYVFKNKIPHMPVDYHELADNTLNKLCCNDSQLRLLIEEILGYGMFRRNELRTSFMLLGDRRSGKSTFLTILKRLFGEENYTTLSLTDLEDRFRPAELDGKLVNIGDDIDSKYIENDSMFKVLVSGETVMIERKGKDPYPYRSTVKFFFAMNKLPQVNDKGSGFIDRVVVFPFEGIFDKNQPDYDPFIIKKLTEPDALGYFLKIGLQGLKRVLENNGFTRPEQVIEKTEEYDKINNPHREFILETKIENEPVSKIRELYNRWCNQNGYHPLNARNFNAEVKRILNLMPNPRREGVKVSKCYLKIEK